MSGDARRDALAPFIGEWRILATFGDTPAAGRWELCHDGTTWDHDFDLTYARG